MHHPRGSRELDVGRGMPARRYIRPESLAIGGSRRENSVGRCNFPRFQQFNGPWRSVVHTVRVEDNLLLGNGWVTIEALHEGKYDPHGVHGAALKEWDMKKRFVALASAAAAMIAAPVAANAAAASRSVAPVENEQELGGSLVIVLLAVAAVVAGIIIIADDDDEAVSA